MKRAAILVSLILLFHTCTYRDYDKFRCDCSQGYPPPEPIYCPGDFCQSDTCQTYFNIWKEIFLEQNRMTQQYFDDHIIMCTSGIYHWNDGISFHTYFKIRIGWVEVRMYDQFPIFISTTLYPGLTVPRDTLLNKDQVMSLLDENYFSAQITRIIPVNELRYSSKEEAMKALNRATGVDTFCIGSAFFPQRSNNIYTIGHPYVQASGTLSWQDNRCIEGSIDLVNGETYSDETICWILFCFTGETEISMADGTTKPIGKIKAGDKVLSIDLKTMKVEEDLVQKIDSVVHYDIFAVTFSDATITNCTGNHPFLVRGKGWCSARPLETPEKNKLKVSRLEPGDTCYRLTGNSLKEVSVKSIARKPGSVMTYNISRLKRNKSYFANRIVVSNEE